MGKLRNEGLRGFTYHVVLKEW